jgi:hypothetical protein
MLCYAILCNTILYYAMLYYAAIGADRLLKASHYCLRNGAAVFQAPPAPPAVEAARARASGGGGGGGGAGSSLLPRGGSSFSFSSRGAGAGAGAFQDGGLPFSLPGGGRAHDQCATLRSWHLQGRVREGGAWVTLSAHTRADAALLPDVPHLAAAWPVSAKLGAYR